MTTPTADVTVMDVGGTTLRVGSFDTSATGGLHGVRRTRVDGMVAHPGDSVAGIQRRVVEQIVREAERQHDTGAGSGPGRALGIAFAGPVGRDGTVLGAPTVWGEGGAPLPLQEILSARLSVPVVVVNDLTAAAWRYATAEPAPFCLLTVSSGIGNKVFRDGDVLLDAEGHGGELGHWTYDRSPDAPLCDCGGRGHLGAIASGRGVLAAVKRAAAADPLGYAGSSPARAGTTDPGSLTNPEVAAAVRSGDPFVTAVLRSTLVPLAAAVCAVFASIGVRRYVLMGGFALAVGARYRELLVEELVGQGCFGLTAAQVDAMVVLGAEDDDHGLIGMGRLVARRLGEHGGPREHEEHGRTERVTVP
ncbi:ROK family protein [Streptomyces sp. NBC_00094]|uniref:ROK family protein n=1 Tax=Streptomyces sp. NBC_00094 TaxID=2903620 RepID=UPI002255C09B|nr:ROK family protein [Streptomyces sp. NBC_00094]MCX5388970.1 ROK family protein [Streptomyces sp. NBC_00094]